MSCKSGERLDQAGALARVRPTEAVATMNAGSPAWNVAEAAKFLGVSKKTLYRMAASGDVPSFKVGNLRRFDPDALSAWRAKQQSEGSR